MVLKSDGMYNKKLGARGEKAAREYLKKNGWEILESNYKNPFGEIDIIAKKGGHRCLYRSENPTFR